MNGKLPWKIHFIAKCCFFLSLIRQLAAERATQFPAILTKKRACAIPVFASLRNRTLGNSSTAL